MTCFSVLLAGFLPLLASTKPVLDADWEAIGAPLPGTDGEVRTLNFDSLGSLIVGGYFTTIRDIPAHALAKWNGSRWTNFDTSSQSHWSLVFAVTVDSVGNIYASGSWMDESQQTTPCTAKWDGSSWTKIASTGFRTMVFDKKGILYVGGDFDAIGSVAARKVAKWDGKVWSPMGEGFDRSVAQLVFDKDGTLYAGGNFFTTSSGNTQLNGVAKWDGTKWLPIGLGFQGARVFALTFDSAGALYAGGDFYISKAEQLRHVAKWDGTQWTPLGSGLDGNPNQLKFSPKGTLLACVTVLSKTSTDTTTYNIYEWNGTSWKATDSAPGYSGSVTVIEFDSLDVLYAGGSIRSFHGQAVKNLARGLPDRWDALGKGFDAPVTSSILDTTGALVVGGAFRTVAGEPCGPVARWNGTDWFCMGKGLPHGTTTRVLAIDTAGTLFAAGNGDATIGGDDFFARWTGTEWHVIERPASAAFRQLVADRYGNLYAGGSFSQLGQASVSNVARWDGREWHALGAGVNGFVKGMALDSSGRLFVLGDFDSAGGQAIPNLAMWDGTRWSGVYSTTDTLSFIYSPCAIAFDPQGNLYVSGEYFTIGDKYIQMLAKWDGKTWTEIGANFQGGAYRFAFDSTGRMYTTGMFQVKGARTGTVYTLLRLEGTQLASVGSQFDSLGIDDGYSSLINLGDGTFVVGGTFLRAGGKLSPYVTRVRTQTAQSITFDLDTARRYGDPPQALHAVSSSGLPVTFSSGNRRVATTIDDTLRITGGGTTKIVAFQRGNDSIAPAKVRRPLVVAPRKAVVVAKNASKAMGAIDPFLVHADSGLLAGDTLSGNLSRDTGESVGRYVIRQGTLTGAPNYTIDFRDGSFSIEASTRVSRKTSQAEHSLELDAIFPKPVASPDRAGVMMRELDTDRGACTDQCSYQPVDILVPDAGDLLVTVYDLLGTSVFSWRRSFATRDLIDFPTTDDGRKKIPLAWNMRSAQGIPVASGIYIWRIQYRQIDGSHKELIRRTGIR